jgi:hypothetical protein
MDLYDVDEFPPLANITRHTVIQDKIVELWFNLSRKNKTGSYNYNIALSEILELLKSNHDPEYMKYIETLFCMIAQVRDIEFGRGERDLAYSMIYTWYRFFPVLAIYALEILVQSSGVKDRSYGSWKDIARLCDYIKNESHDDEHPLIITAIEIANHQLRRDIIAHGCMTDISNVSKWIPREKSKYGWLFPMFIKDFYPRMYRKSDTFEKRVGIFSYHKSKYRKILSALNAYNNTIEIKQCQNRWSYIDFFNYVNKGSLKKYWNALMNQDANFRGPRHIRIDRIECSQRALHYVQLKSTGTLLHNNPPFVYGKYKIPRSGFYSMKEFVKRAIDLHKARMVADPLSLDFMTAEYGIHLLNTAWTKFSESVGRNLGPVIPIVDVSLSMSASDQIYNAIGFAYLISKFSDIDNRIIAFSHQTEWIFLDKLEFVDAIHFIMSSLPFSTSKRFEGVISLLKDAALSNKFGLDNITFVLLSDFTEPDMIIDKSALKNLVLWNLSEQYVGEGYGISGSSISSFGELCNMSPKITKFDYIVNSLNHLRYDPMRDLFRKITS